MSDRYKGYYIVQGGSKFFVAIELCCIEEGIELNHMLIISGPFSSYKEADDKRKNS